MGYALSLVHDRARMGHFTPGANMESDTCSGIAVADALADALADPLDDARRHAAETRTRSDFIYAVTTTGIDCRPGCPAHAPLRANVRFFAAPADARAAGFRACKRCQPDAPRDA